MLYNVICRLISIQHIYVGYRTIRRKLVSSKLFDIYTSFKDSMTCKRILIRLIYTSVISWWKFANLIKVSTGGLLPQFTYIIHKQTKRTPVTFCPHPWEKKMGCPRVPAKYLPGESGKGIARNVVTAKREDPATPCSIRGNRVRVRWHVGSWCLIHTCSLTHSYAWDDSFMCVRWLIHVCDMHQSYS